MLRRRPLLSALAPLLLFAVPPAAAEGVAWPEGGGYRTHDYRAPTPLTVPGGRMIGTEEARALLGRYGPLIKGVLDRHLNLVLALLVVAIVGGFVAFRYLF